MPYKPKTDSSDYNDPPKDPDRFARLQREWIEQHGYSGIFELLPHDLFNDWWKKEGYHFKPETDDEKDWVNVVRYWAWKAWEARNNGKSRKCKTHRKM